MSAEGTALGPRSRPGQCGHPLSLWGEEREWGKNIKKKGHKSSNIKKIITKKKTKRDRVCERGSAAAASPPRPAVPQEAARCCALAGPSRTRHVRGPRFSLCRTGTGDKGPGSFSGFGYYYYYCSLFLVNCWHVSSNETRGLWGDKLLLLVFFSLFSFFFFFAKFFYFCLNSHFNFNS